MKIAESLLDMYRPANILTKKEQLLELKKDVQFRGSAGAITNADGDTYEKWIPEPWAPGELEQFYQDNFESFRYTDSNGKVSYIKIPENNTAKVDALGRPITRIQALMKGAMAVTQFTNDHYAKYMTLPNIDTHEDFAKALTSIMAGKDYKGMSDAEKYQVIHDRYAKIFGKDFLKAEAGGYEAPHAPYRYTMVLEQFHQDLNAAIGSDDSITQAARTALYGDMSSADIRGQIASKYPPGNQMTLRDLYNMTWEMEQVGVGEGMRDLVTNAADFLNHVGSAGKFTITIDDRIRLRESMLDQKLDLDFLGSVYNKMAKAGSITSETGQLLQEHLGMTFDQNGKATNEDSGTSKWFQAIADWLSNDDIVRVKESPMNWTVV